MNKLIAFVLLLAPAAAFAAKAQTHHCEVDGKEVAKTHKECKAAKGTWAKGAPTTPAAAPAK